MKLIANRAALLKVLNTIIDGIPPKTPEPNYMNFLLTLNNEEKTLLASDGIITIFEKLDSEKNQGLITSFEEGCVEIPARYFASIVSKLEGDEVEITQIENSVLNITDHVSNFNINCVRGEEFPQLDINFTASHEFTITGADFLSLYSSTAFAVATRGPKKQFYGVKIGVKDKVLDFVATDSYRLAQRKISIDNEERFSFIVPVKALSLVSKYCESKPINIKADNNIASFEVDGLTVICRLFVGDFPYIERIIPVETPYVLTVESKVFLNALGRVATVLDSGKIQTVTLKCNEDGAELYARSDHVGNSADPLKGATFVGSSFEICFNYSYVIDAIRALDSEKISLAFAGEGKTFMVKTDDINNVQIVTPLRSNSGQ